MSQQLIEDLTSKEPVKAELNEAILPKLDTNLTSQNQGVQDRTSEKSCSEL